MNAFSVLLVVCLVGAQEPQPNIEFEAPLPREIVIQSPVMPDPGVMIDSRPSEPIPTIREFTKSHGTDKKPTPAIYNVPNPPIVTNIAATKQTDNAENVADSTSPPQPKVVREAIFRCPARFELSHFNSDGAEVPSEGIVIYEGMRLTTYDTGEFELNFDMMNPGTPTTMRLQFLVRFGIGAETIQHTLTIPPIVVNDNVVPTGNFKGSLNHVNYKGYSPLFDPCVCPTALSDWCIARRGAARFGNLPLQDQTTPSTRP